MKQLSSMFNNKIIYSRWSIINDATSEDVWDAVWGVRTDTIDVTPLIRQIEEEA